MLSLTILQFCATELTQQHSAVSKVRTHNKALWSIYRQGR